MEQYFRPFIDLVLDYSYVAEFVILFACGLGLPVPEEVTLIAGGYICFRGLANLWITIGVCMVAILLGDYLMFLLGRRYGKGVLRSRWFRRLLPSRKMARVTLYFRKYGAKTVFFARFFAGIRVPVYFMAGSMRMGRVKFLWLDSLGALLSVPISIWAGNHFGENIRQAIEVMQRWKTATAIAILASVALYVAYRVIRSRRAAAHPRPLEV